MGQLAPSPRPRSAWTIETGLVGWSRPVDPAPSMPYMVPGVTELRSRTPEGTTPTASRLWWEARSLGHCQTASFCAWVLRAIV